MLARSWLNPAPGCAEPGRRTGDRFLERDRRALTGAGDAYGDIRVPGRTGVARLLGDERTRQREPSRRSHCVVVSVR